MVKLFSLIITGIMLGSIYGLTGLGYSMIYKSSGLMNFVQGDIMTLGAYLGVTFFSLLQLPYWISLLLTMVCSFGFGVLLERLAIRGLLRKPNINAIYVILATIAISYMLQNGLQLTWGTLAYNFPSIFDVMSIKLFGVVAVQPETLLCVGVAVVLMILLHFFMNKTTFGTAMRAASMDRLAAESCGVNVNMTTAVSWGLSCMLAAVGGVLIGPMYGVYVTLGSMIGTKSFTSSVIGGFGNMIGAVVGGMILGVFEVLVSGYLSSTYKNLFAYVVLLVFLYVKPTGIFNERALQDV